MPKFRFPIPSSCSLSGRCQAHTYITLTRLIVGPLQFMLRQLAYLSSLRWETRQRAEAARRYRNGERGVNSTFRLCIMAEGTHEQSALEKLRYLLFSDVMWQFLHPDELNVRMRSLAYLMPSVAIS